MYSEEEDKDRQAMEPGTNTEGPELTAETVLYASFRAQLVYYRRKAGLTQEGLGDKLGVTHTRISDYERGNAVVPDLKKEGGPPSDLENLVRVLHEKGVLDEWGKTRFRTAYGESVVEYRQQQALKEATKVEQASRQQHVISQQIPAPECRSEEPSEASGATRLSDATLQASAQPLERGPYRVVRLIRLDIPVSAPTPRQFWQSRALTWALFSTIALLALALVLSSSTFLWASLHAYPSSPASPAKATYTLKHTSPCTWVIVLLGKHFHKYSHVHVVIPEHASVDCKTGIARITEARSLAEETVSATGIWGPVSFVQNDYGSFQFEISDDAGPNHSVGHFVRLTITYDKNTVPWRAPWHAPPASSP